MSANASLHGARGRLLAAGRQAASIELGSTRPGRTVARCTACLGRGEMLLPKVAFVAEAGTATPISVSEASSLDVEGTVQRGLQVIVRGELPVMSLLEHGAVAFVQLGESPSSRSWGAIRRLDGHPVDSADLRELIEASETSSFTAHTQVDLMVDTAVPSYLRYQLVADFPMVHMPVGGDIHAAVCTVWPQDLPAEMQTLIPASNRTHG